MSSVVMLNKARIFLSIGMIGVVGLGGWFFYNTIQERNDLLKEVEQKEQQIKQCMDDQEKLQELVNSYKTKIEEQNEDYKRLKKENKEIQKEHREEERRLQRSLQQIQDEDVGDDCQSKMDWLRTKAIELQENDKEE